MWIKISFTIPIRWVKRQSIETCFSTQVIIYSDTLEPKKQFSIILENNPTKYFVLYTYTFKIKEIFLRLKYCLVWKVKFTTDLNSMLKV